MKVGDGPSTNWRGETTLDVWLPGCPSVDFEVYPETPTGYVLTTQPRLKANTKIQNQVFEFGFNYLPNVPTVTPIPPKPVCKSYKLGQANKYDLTDLAITPNGTIWVSSYGNGVYQLPPNNTEWINYNRGNGLVGNYIRSITVASDGSVWFAAREGASHYDGKVWTSYTATDGLRSGEVAKVAINKKVVWFATYDGVSMLDTSTKTWRSFTAKDGLADNFVEFVTISQNGSIWFSTFEGVSRLDWPSYPSGNPNWTKYSYDVNHIEIQPNNVVWLGGFSGIEFIDLNTDSTTDFTTDLRKGGFQDSINIFEFDPDNSLWLGSSTQNTIYHVIINPDTNQVVLRSYDFRDGLPKNYNQDDQIEAIAFAPDNYVWIGTREHATRCLFLEK